jgi:exopolyphosphatase/guanosine-5'-triphosphate,3'-diphosphate pyrophosphatase
MLTNGPRVGVIDIGSNSIRLVVYDRLCRMPVPLCNEKVLCGLGRGVERSGQLNPRGVEQALANLVRFRMLADHMGVIRLDGLATAAVRDTEDGPAFIAAVRERAGIEVRIIDGEEEARLSALGVLSAIPGADGIAADLGGGSLELIGLDRGALGPRLSLPLGPLRLLESGGERPSASQKLIEQTLARVDWLGAFRRRRLYLVGGSWRAIAKLHIMQTRYPLHVIHQYSVPGADLTGFAAGIAKQSRAGLEKMPGASRRRLETLPLAALVLEHLLRLAEPAAVVFSAYGLREGHMFDLLSAEERRSDPLLAATTELARRHDRFGATDLIASWTDGLFAGEDAAAARLRRAACLLSDLCWDEHPDYRTEHAFLRILRLPIVGTDHFERAFLALVGHARYGGNADDAWVQEVQRLLPGHQVRRSQVLGLALRLAHSLTGGVAALLHRIPIRLTAETLILELPADLAGLDGDVVGRRLQALASALNREWQVVIRPA